jgi:hypothetical protein
MNATELFLRDHSRIHAQGVGEAEAGMYLEDMVLGGLTDDQVRMRPVERVNSLAWLFWHMARTEDMAINTVVFGKPQVIESDGWLERLGLSRNDVGTGMTDDEVGDFTARVDLPAMRAYRAAVGKRTQELVRAMPLGDWEQPVDADAMQRAQESGAIGPNAGWLVTVFGGKTKALLISHASTCHGFWRLGEAVTVRSLCGAPLGI